MKWEPFFYKIATMRLEALYIPFCQVKEYPYLCKDIERNDYTNK